MFSTTQHKFVKLSRDTTKQIETKIKGVLRKIKTNIITRIFTFIRLDLLQVNSMELRKYTSYHQQVIYRNYL